MSLHVSKTILEQLGGRHFIAMTGAKDFIGGDDGLSFKLPGRSGYVRQNINQVMITLKPDDTYTLQFYRRRKSDVKLVQELVGIYNDQLCEVFTQVTGLYTSLGTMKVLT